MLRSKNKESFNIIKYLLENGADSNIILKTWKEEHNTPLKTAVANWNKPAVALLLHKGYSYSWEKSSTGEDIFKMVELKGADRVIKGDTNPSALEIAKRNQHIWFDPSDKTDAAVQDRAEIIKLLSE